MHFEEENSDSSSGAEEFDELYNSLKPLPLNYNELYLRGDVVRISNTNLFDSQSFNEDGFQLVQKRNRKKKKNAGEKDCPQLKLIKPLNSSKIRSKTDNNQSRNKKIQLKQKENVLDGSKGITKKRTRNRRKKININDITSASVKTIIGGQSLRNTQKLNEVDGFNLKINQLLPKKKRRRGGRGRGGRGRNSRALNQDNNVDNNITFYLSSTFHGQDTIKLENTGILKNKCCLVFEENIWTYYSYIFEGENYKQFHSFKDTYLNKCLDSNTIQKNIFPIEITSNFNHHNNILDEIDVNGVSEEIIRQITPTINEIKNDIAEIDNGKNGDYAIAKNKCDIFFEDIKWTYYSYAFRGKNYKYFQDFKESYLNKSLSSNKRQESELVETNNTKFGDCTITKNKYDIFFEDVKWTYYSYAFGKKNYKYFQDFKESYLNKSLSLNKIQKNAPRTLNVKTTKKIKSSKTNKNKKHIAQINNKQTENCITSINKCELMYEDDIWTYYSYAFQGTNFKNFHDFKDAYLNKSFKQNKMLKNRNSRFRQKYCNRHEVEVEKNELCIQVFEPEFERTNFDEEDINSFDEKKETEPSQDYFSWKNALEHILGFFSKKTSHIIVFVVGFIMGNILR